MQVILTDKVVKLGKFGDQVNAKAGYVRNFLIPKHKAVPATKKNIEHYNMLRAELERKLAHARDIAAIKISKIKEINSITINVKTSQKGKLFGSINVQNIVDAIASYGIKINKNEIRLPCRAIHAIGEYEAIIKVHSDFYTTLRVIVAPEV